jgi:hypothetical protein
VAGGKRSAQNRPRVCHRQADSRGSGHTPARAARVLSFGPRSVLTCPSQHASCRFADVAKRQCHRPMKGDLCVPDTHPTRSRDESVLVNEAAEDRISTKQCRIGFVD